MAKIKKRIVEYYFFYCQACGREHTYVVVSDGSQWQFNGNMESPTFTPSLLNRIPLMNKETNTIEYKETCHLFVTDGKIIYCSDCTHGLAGQTIELPEIN